MTGTRVPNWLPGTEFAVAEVKGEWLEAAAGAARAAVTKTAARMDFKVFIACFS